LSNRTNTPPLAAPRPELLETLGAATLGVRARATDRLASAHDASHYVLVPEVVVTPTSHLEVAAVLVACRRMAVPVTFRSGGTSLSGQAGTDGVLVDTRRFFRDIRVLDDGARVRCEPGATVRSVNLRLARHGRKLGPDPASEIACTIGGVVANNSSGMACGTTANAYQTLESSVLVLPSGTVVDTSLPDAEARFRDAEPDLHAGLIALRDRVRANPESVDTVRRLFAIKNTMGYAVNAFLDFDAPVDILEHLVVGSEGTLAFVAEATFRTVASNPHLATGLLVFPTLAAATDALPRLVAAGFATIELLDASSLRVAQGDPQATQELRALTVIDHAALLVEFQEETPEALARRVADASRLVTTLDLADPATLSADPARRAALWHVRKGLFALVAGHRPPGTTALLEDIAVPVERLGATCAALTALFDAHGYDGAVIFGHAKDGNIHFLLNERFDDAECLARYGRFTEDMVALVLEQGGTLKAEHGTGRIMAPFVRRQYGDELYAVMRSIKELIDPDLLLNPGVLLTDDPESHIRNLKFAPPVDAEVDRCVECGYCEPVCPSRDLTLTPRERIVIRRELAAAEAAGDSALAATLRTEYGYDGVDTCAVDGMCQTACPVLINTGDLVRRLRSENATGVERAVGRAAAANWDAVSRLGGLALTVADRLPAIVPRLATDAARAVLGADTVPRYSAELPAGGPRRPQVAPEDPVAVFFSSCTTTLFGPAGANGGAGAAFHALCERAGVSVASPPGLPSLCCGTPWKSKGLGEGYAQMTARVATALRLATDGGRLPVVCDASSCTEGLATLLEAAEEGGIRVLDAVAFVAEFVLPRLPRGSRLPSVTLHPTCSSTRLGLASALSAVAAAIADEVVIPDDWNCCGFAGDRGMLHPELTAAATAREADEVRATASSAHASLNRTCELGLTRATGKTYLHILELLDEVTVPTGS